MVPIHTAEEEEEEEEEYEYYSAGVFDVAGCGRRLLVITAMSALERLDRDIAAKTIAYHQARSNKAFNIERAENKAAAMPLRRGWVLQAEKWSDEEDKYLADLKELETKRLELLEKQEDIRRLELLEKREDMRRLQLLEKKYRRRGVRDRYDDAGSTLRSAAIGYAMVARHAILSSSHERRKTKDDPALAPIQPLLEHKALGVADHCGAGITAHARTGIADALVRHTLAHAAGNSAAAAFVAYEMLGPHWTQYHHYERAMAAKPSPGMETDDLDFLSHAIMASAAAAAGRR
jgi:hypothetical protein